MKPTDSLPPEDDIPAELSAQQPLSPALTGYRRRRSIDQLSSGDPSHVVEHKHELTADEIEHKHNPPAQAVNPPQTIQPAAIQVEETDDVITLTGDKLTAKITQDGNKHIPTLTLSSVNEVTDPSKQQDTRTYEADIVGMLDKLREILAKNRGQWKTVNGKFVLKVSGDQDLQPKALAQLKQLIDHSAHFITAEKAATIEKPAVRIQPVQTSSLAEALKTPQAESETLAETPDNHSTFPSM